MFFFFCKICVLHLLWICQEADMYKLFFTVEIMSPITQLLITLRKNLKIIKNIFVSGQRTLTHLFNFIFVIN